ncbi:RecX family transcriptional regulator [Paenibacillus sp.]|uniref:RecX family transcriptional regulator n=1 Tax=Paenibacillus sp. TaxID=58172 RepID=UPI002D468469|nr:RecX family transcriptional regulator [Paenibacillus sp.]HZG86785.1 RecX family transcriptional regulator [Paenibacillus sp.]
MERQEGVVTSVERQKKQRQRYNVFVDEQFAFAVHEDVLMKYRLFKGQVVTADRLADIVRDEERQDAYTKVVKWLGGGLRSEKEIRGYLSRKGYEEDTVDACVERLRAQSYVDDERLSRTLAEDRLKLQSKGKQWIRRELLQKGVDKSTVQEAVGSIDAGEEAAAALAVARKRWRTLGAGDDPAAAKRKLYAYLARRGFSAGAVREAVRQTASGADGSDDEWDWE